MYLTKLIDKTIKVYKSENERLKISGISFDSRKIKKGMLFAVTKENNQYISDALKLGAQALLCKKRDVNNLTHVLKFKDLNVEFKKIFGIELRRDNTNDKLKELKLFLKNNLHLFRKDIEIIYKEDLDLYNRFFLFKK